MRVDVARQVCIRVGETMCMCVDDLSAVCEYVS